MQIRACLRLRNSWLCSSNEPEAPARSLVESTETLDLLLVHQRHPQSRRKKYFCAAEVWSGNAGHGKGMLVQLNRAPYHRWIAMEMTAPIGITEYDVRTAVGALLIGSVKETAKVRLKAESVEVISTRFIDPYLGWVAIGVQPRGREVERENAV